MQEVISVLELSEHLNDGRCPNRVLIDNTQSLLTKLIETKGGNNQI